MYELLRSYRAGVARLKPGLLLVRREQIGDKVTISVCQNFACQMPVTQPAALAEQLR